MVDTEMQEQDVTFGAEDVLVETKYLEEEPLEPENYQNPSEIPQPLVLGDGQANNGHGMNGGVGVVDHSERKTRKVQMLSPKTEVENARKRKTWLLDSEAQGVDEAGTPVEQVTFLREVEAFYKENFLEFKPPKFYGQPLNILKLWRAVINLGGYEVVTTNKLWRQVGESFHPPKTCTTVSYTFRNFYEKALLEYEKCLRKNGELNLPGSTLPLSSSLEKEASSHQGPGSGRARRDSAARAMQGWHAQRLVGSGEGTAPVVKDKGLNSTPKHKKLKSIGLQKHKPQTSMDLFVSNEADKQSAAEVVDVGPLADWVKINVKETKDSFEIFALVPGLLRKEVRIQSDPAGKVVITGQPEQLDNPWGITPFKKIVDLSARIDPLNTSAVMSMHGRLFIRVPFEQ
ncbi:Alpha crystallin/Hsp20 domain [Arabidopsis suecica]|uniref:Alpha crystallin/Hsp20 domain n=1 Tax=Arabidopsis suecica TaxID=45249 RepID=A0A8T2CHU7_ARASU|nr:Alpha crystallin/Hsp20 domain [Arabidopsis suecica]